MAESSRCAACLVRLRACNEPLLEADRPHRNAEEHTHTEAPHFGQSGLADGALAGGTLSKQDQETIKLVVSEVAGCDYCAAAHSLLGKLAGLSPEALRQIRAGEPTGDAKRDALVRFVRVLQRTSGTIDEAELSAIRAAGYTDAQLVEISLAIAVTAFTNVFNRINDTTLDFPPVV